jgi:hypothetical protein
MTLQYDRSHFARSQACLAQALDCRNQAWKQVPTQSAMAVAAGEGVDGEGRVTTDEDGEVARMNYGSGVSGTKAPAAVEGERGDKERCDGAEVEGDGGHNEDQRDEEEACCEVDRQAGGCADLDQDAAAPGGARAAAAVPKDQNPHFHQDV